MPKNRLLASLAVTAGLLAGGATAIIFGPTASGAQTSTTEAPPTTAAPAPGGTTTPTPAPGTARPHDGNCPNMGGSGAQGSGTPGTSGTSAGGSGAATQQLSFRRM
jgi:hypothetical protein